MLRAILVPLRAAKFSITNLRQYLVQKFPDITPEQVSLCRACVHVVERSFTCMAVWGKLPQFEFTCKGVALTGKEHTLDFVLKTTWRDKTRIMELQYSIGAQ